MSILIPAALAFSLAAGLAPSPADAACYGSGCYVYHHPPHPYAYRHWNGYYGEDYRQWRMFGGNRGDW
jgi:hypothetical protein